MACRSILVLVTASLLVWSGVAKRQAEMSISSLAEAKENTQSAAHVSATMKSQGGECNVEAAAEDVQKILPNKDGGRLVTDDDKWNDMPEWLKQAYWGHYWDECGGHMKYGGARLAAQKPCTYLTLLCGNDLTNQFWTTDSWDSEEEEKAFGPWTVDSAQADLKDTLGIRCELYKEKPTDCEESSLVETKEHTQSAAHLSATMAEARRARIAELEAELAALKAEEARSAVGECNVEAAAEDVQKILPTNDGGRLVTDDDKWNGMPEWLKQAYSGHFWEKCGGNMKWGGARLAAQKPCTYLTLLCGNDLRNDFWITDSWDESEDDEKPFGAWTVDSAEANLKGTLGIRCDLYKELPTEC